MAVNVSVREGSKMCVRGVLVWLINQAHHTANPTQSSPSRLDPERERRRGLWLRLRRPRDRERDRERLRLSRRREEPRRLGLRLRLRLGLEKQPK